MSVLLQAPIIRTDRKADAKRNFQEQSQKCRDQKMLRDIIKKEEKGRRRRKRRRGRRQGKEEEKEGEGEDEEKEEEERKDFNKLREKIRCFLRVRAAFTNMSS